MEGGAEQGGDGFAKDDRLGAEEAGEERVRDGERAVPPRARRGRGARVRHHFLPRPVERVRGANAGKQEDEVRDVGGFAIGRDELARLVGGEGGAGVGAGVGVGADRRPAPASP